MSERQHRHFPGKSWVVNALRVLHLAGVVGFGAALLSADPAARCGAWCPLLALSGAAILVLDLWSNPAYALQVKGAGMLAKLLLLAALVLFAEGQLAIFWTVLAASVLVSHMPGRLRNRRLFGRP